MSPNEHTNLYELLTAFRAFAEAHDQINHFDVGPVDEADIAKMSADDHPLLYVTPGSVTLDEGTIEMDLDIIVATMQPPDLADRTAVMSNQLYILKDVVAWLKHHLYDGTFRGRITLTLPVIAEPFSVRLDNMLVGWGATVGLQWNNENDLCLVPRT